MFSKDCSIELTFQYFYFVFDYYWFIELQLNRYKLILFLLFIICQVFFFGVLCIIIVLLIIDLFVCIGWISVNWYWNFSSGLIAGFLWNISKPGIRICFPRRSLKGHGEGSGCVFRLFCFNLLLCLI